MKTTTSAQVTVTEALRLYAHALAYCASDPAIRSAAAKSERRLNRAVVRQSVLGIRPIHNLNLLRKSREELRS